MREEQEVRASVAVLVGNVYLCVLLFQSLYFIGKNSCFSLIKQNLIMQQKMWLVCEHHWLSMTSLSVCSTEWAFNRLEQQTNTFYINGDSEIPRT